MARLGLSQLKLKLNKIIREYSKLLAHIIVFYKHNKIFKFNVVSKN